jgi:hypothetical protein
VEQVVDMTVCSTHLIGLNTMLTISKEEYQKAGQVFHWATQNHYKLWFTGNEERHRRTEQMLPRLVRKGKLVSNQYGKKFIYAVPRMKDTPIEHGLGVTETIVRICRSGQGGEYIPERYFKGLGSVPDWGINYNGKLLLIEYSSKSNLEQGIVKSKLTKYESNLTNLINKFNATQAIVLFVLDVSRERVKNFVFRVQPDEQYFFTDFETFKSVPFGQQLTTLIYFWRDGNEYPLKENA